MASGPPATIVRFGIFEVNLATRELLKEGRKIKLQEQPFQLLVLLLNQPGAVVSREELQQALWPNDSYGDFDQGVNTAVRKIRQALGDIADNPRFIETLPRRGYRFIAPISVPETGAKPEVSGTVATPKISEIVVRPESVPDSRRSPRTRLWFAAAAILAALVFAVLFAWRSDANESSAAVPLTSYRGTELEPTFSPDGSHVAFSWNGPDESNFDIYVKPIHLESAVRLTQDPRRDFGPAWSPDGKLIAFGRILDEQRAGIFLIPAGGGPEVKLLEQAPHQMDWDHHPFLSWSPDGKWLAISDGDVQPGNAPPQFGLFLLSIETGERRRLTTLPPKHRPDIAPAFSPDGRSIAFLRQTPQLGQSLMILPLTAQLMPSAEPREIGLEAPRTASLAWLPGGDELLLSVWKHDGTSTGFWRAGVSGKRPWRRIPGESVNIESVAISKSGQVAYARRVADRNIWKIDLDTAGNASSKPQPFIASTQHDANSRFSPDGKQVAFTSNRNGSLEVWICDSDASHPRQLTTMGEGMVGSPQWYPDGSHILFDASKGDNWDLYSILAAGGPPRRLTDSPGIDALGTFSRDGQSIYFMSVRGGQSEIWKMPAGGGPATQITHHGGRYAIESPDGRSLYYSKDDSAQERSGNGGIWRVSVAGGAEERVVPSVAFLSFTLSRDGLFYTPSIRSGGVYSIYYTPFTTLGNSRKIVDITGAPRPGMTISPDGLTLLWGQADQVASDLMLLDRIK